MGSSEELPLGQISDTSVRFTCLFPAVLGLRCCTPAFSSSGVWGLLLVAVRGLSDRGVR